MSQQGVLDFLEKNKGFNTVEQIAQGCRVSICSIRCNLTKLGHFVESKTLPNKIKLYKLR